jgi:glycine dehydrogenase
MLSDINCKSIEELISKTIPEKIRLTEELKLTEPLSEFEFLSEINSISKKNKLYKSYIGLGYNPTILPSVIRRNILENPGWYTQYTPYQAEISQGRLEALLNFQTLIVELTGLPIANASLLDEGTAAAEAINMLHSSRKGKKVKANKIFVSGNCFPQTIDVIKTRANPNNIEVIVGNYNEFTFEEDFFAVIVQYPGCDGEINDYSDFAKRLKENDIKLIVAADLMSLALLIPPSEFDADVAVGSTQRFGVPLGFGGPHAAYFATKDEYKRIIPGRIIGLSVDSANNPAYRMALQTREQHIRREKATSNICTAQVLLAIMAGMYAVYHGKEGIRNIAEKIHYSAIIIDELLKKLNYKQINRAYFDTLKIEIEDENIISILRKRAEEKKINFRYYDKFIGISLNETVSFDDISEIIEVFDIEDKLKNKRDEIDNNYGKKINIIPVNLSRATNFLNQNVFNRYHSETEMMRYIKSLENKDLSLTGSIIPLGSCTMKLNAASEMFAITFPEFSEIHPFAPLNQAEGYMMVINELENDLAEITGFDSVSLQPNSGAQGEFTGLMVIREYHINNGNKNRNVVLIPSSAHGTNPASAIMSGMKVVVVGCDANGNIDINDLENKSEQNKDELAALMVTYPSTHGVFEEHIKEICDIIHKNGGQVYMDGANMNAQVGYTSPAIIGADVCHLNLHKTFAIPHGGGGPGIGPIAVAKHLTPFLPGHSVVNNINKEKSITAVSSAPWGSAGVLLISYAYIKMMGTKGLKKSTETAILNANYVKSKLENYYKVLYTGTKGMVAHELIFDLRDFSHNAEVTAEDISKRLMDYSFHAPTVSFPVPGTFMFEPTESESKEELDRFIEAMINIRKEIQDIEDGVYDKADNLLKNAPHTSMSLTVENWEHKYSREKAAFPVEGLKKNKFWPSVGRINNAYGDRNIVCSC